MINFKDLSEYTMCETIYRCPICGKETSTFEQADEHYKECYDKYKDIFETAKELTAVLEKAKERGILLIDSGSCGIDSFSIALSPLDPVSVPIFMIYGKITTEEDWENNHKGEQK